MNADEHGWDKAICVDLCVSVVAVAVLLLGCERSESRRQPKQQARSDSRTAKGAELAKAPPCCSPEEVEKVKDVSSPSGRQVACPVSGEAVDPNVCVVHKGRCVYFCSKACAEDFAKEPEKYLKKLDEQGVVLERASSCRHLER